MVFAKGKNVCLNESRMNLNPVFRKASPRAEKWRLFKALVVGAHIFIGSLEEAIPIFYRNWRVRATRFYFLIGFSPDASPEPPEGAWLHAVKGQFFFRSSFRHGFCKGQKRMPKRIAYKPQPGVPRGSTPGWEVTPLQGFGRGSAYFQWKPWRGDSYLLSELTSGGDKILSFDWIFARRFPWTPW